MALLSPRRKAVPPCNVPATTRPENGYTTSVKRADLPRKNTAFCEAQEKGPHTAQCPDCFSLLGQHAYGALYHIVFTVIPFPLRQKGIRRWCRSGSVFTIFFNVTFDIDANCV
jgi:hypothetical protein